MSLRKEHRLNTMSLTHWCVTAVAALVMAAFHVTVLAAPPSEWTPNVLEQRQLPAACQPGYNIKGCGERFNHFCPALVALNRAEQVTAPKKDRMYYKGNAGNHLRYTRQHMPPSCPLAENLRAAEFRLKMLDITLK